MTTVATNFLRIQDFVLTRGNPDSILTTSSAEIQPGQQVTVILLNLDENIKNGRDTQFKLTTAQRCCICWNCDSPVNKVDNSTFFPFYEKKWSNKRKMEKK